ncbi:DUF3710 domain-containing protein [Nocardioides sp. zg-536]|uniref:DUF3710 domain-containing protein n=1 Tax=Nocardioides faecalis TaxID=2803858 RepID=A0A938Y7D4_9ACTN|nr:DUF3710 domain-containing protein [Nocardioides faecalis]MBM9460567.1 DUF3710 domain-containing protein [Nocardioides faecalis]MBS4754370.1 DUF3710 domain-containing protein [Nocardioides faecalis]QVI57505.1 DUF3710 domain-containing protein [Nocardioides faecalis]
MRLRRKAADAVADGSTIDTSEEGAETEAPRGPYDADDVPDDGVDRVDLGSLLIAPVADRELRMQVDEASGEVKAVLLANDEGAVELRAFAAPRNGDLWSEIRPQIAADTARRGGTATEREGAYGTELVCEVRVARADGTTGVQTSRVVGINGPRWLLRATYLGEPARSPEDAGEWEDAVARLAVRRGNHAMPVGEQLPLSLPEGARPKAAPES